jgi:predicted amino acid racemase
MTRQEAVSHIKNLYGFEHDSVTSAIASLGSLAFSDEALEQIAQAQLQVERRLGQELAAVERYQKSHPGIGWNEAKMRVQRGQV